MYWILIWQRTWLLESEEKWSASSACTVTASISFPGRICNHSVQGLLRIETNCGDKASSSLAPPQQLKFCSSFQRPKDFKKPFGKTHSSASYIWLLRKTIFTEEISLERKENKIHSSLYTANVIQRNSEDEYYIIRKEQDKNLFLSRNNVWFFVFWVFFTISFCQKRQEILNLECSGVKTLLVLNKKRTHDLEYQPACSFEESTKIALSLLVLWVPLSCTKVL